jgi:hypothetical protein
MGAILGMAFTNAQQAHSSAHRCCFNTTITIPTPDFDWVPYFKWDKDGKMTGYMCVAALW